MCHFQSQTVGKLLVYRVPSHTKPQWSGPWSRSTWSTLTLISECNTLRLWRCCSPDTNWCKSPESLAGILWSTRDVLLARQGKQKCVEAHVQHFHPKNLGQTMIRPTFFFPTISGNSETFLEWPSGTQARRANRTPQVFSQCQASQDQPPGYHRRPFPSPQFLAYHPQKPWVCFSINLFMSAISAPFWGGPFLFFWHWGVLKWIWQTYKTHSKCWHHWFWKFTGNHCFLPSNIGLSCKNFPSSNSMMASSKCFQQWGSKSWRAKPLIPNPLGVVDQPVEEGAWGAIEITTYHLGMNNQTWKVLYVDI